MSNEKDHAAEVSRLEARVKELTTERHFVNAQYDSLRAQLEAAKAQLTAQPDGVREAAQMAVDSWRYTQEGANPTEFMAAMGELQDALAAPAPSAEVK